MKLIIGGKDWIFEKGANGFAKSIDVDRLRSKLFAVGQFCISKDPSAPRVFRTFFVLSCSPYFSIF